MSDETQETAIQDEDQTATFLARVSDLGQPLGRINKRALKRGFLAALIFAGLFTIAKKFQTKEA